MQDLGLENPLINPSKFAELLGHHLMKESLIAKFGESELIEAQVTLLAELDVLGFGDAVDAIVTLSRKSDIASVLAVSYYIGLLDYFLLEPLIDRLRLAAITTATVPMIRQLAGSKVISAKVQFPYEVGKFLDNKLRD